MVNNHEILEQSTFLQHEHDVRMEGSSVVIQTDEASHNDDKSSIGQVKSSEEENEGMGSMVSDTASSEPSIEQPVEGPFPFDEQRLHLLTQEISKVVKAKVRALKLEANKKTTQPAVAAEPQVGDSSSQRKRKRCDVSGEHDVSFELPADFLHDDLHYHLTPNLEGQRKMEPQFSFFQRLKCWRIQIRERSKGQQDAYFYHKPSGGFFRSVTEVKAFIIFESYPPNTSPSGRAKRAMKILEGEAAVAVQERPTSALAIHERPQHEQIVHQPLPPPPQLEQRPIYRELEILPQYHCPQLYNSPENQEVEFEILENGAKFYKFV